jgi:hypothetical protein
MTLPNPSLPALDYARSLRQPALEELLELLRFPTISADFPANLADFGACADWLVRALFGMGFQRAQRLPRRRSGGGVRRIAGRKR